MVLHKISDQYLPTCKVSTGSINMVKRYTPGANLTYLAPPPPPGQFFMGAKSFIGTPEMQRIFVLKDKLNCTMKKCMVSMATINTILKHGGGHRKLTISQLLLILATEIGLILKLRHSPFIL